MFLIHKNFLNKKLKEEKHGLLVQPLKNRRRRWMKELQSCEISFRERFMIKGVFFLFTLFMFFFFFQNFVYLFFNGLI